MKYVYIGKEYFGDNFRNSIEAEASLNKWLELIILREEPYQAEHLMLDNPSEETKTLLKLCKFFSAILRDEHPKPIPSSEWSAEFEGKHHGLVGTYLNFIRNIYNGYNEHNE